MEDAMQVVTRKVAAFNARDIDALLTELSPDIEWEALGAGLRGKEQAAEFVHSWWEAFPDARLTQEYVGALGSVVGAEEIFTGTHTGTLRTPSGDIPPTGKSVHLRSATFYRVRDGKLVSMRLYADTLKLLTQLGVAPVLSNSATGQ